MYSFDDLSHPILINDMNHCIDDLFKDNINAANAIKAEFEKYFSSYKYENEKDRLPQDRIDFKYGKKKTAINPVARPIWYYINTPGYAFETVIELCVRLYEKKYVPLDEDGF